MDLSKRLKINSCSSVTGGIAAGRIIHIDPEGLILCDDTGCAFFKGSRQEEQAETGDIAAVNFQRTSGQFLIEKITLLTKCTTNPLDNQASLWNKFNKNSGKLHSILQQGSAFFRHIEDFFIDRGFIHIHTPTLVESPGLETNLEPFATSYQGYNGRSRQLYLPTSPEFSLKEALTSGLEKIFEIAKVFRNQGENSRLHRPEFFMLEWYRAYEDYSVIMDDLEALLLYLLDSLGKQHQIEFNRQIIPCTDFKRVKVAELFAPYNINLDLYSSDPALFCSQVMQAKKELGAAGKVQLDEDMKKPNYKEDLFFQFFLDHIEPELGFDKPTIVYEYPLEMTPLSRACPDNKEYGQRFELFIAGIELANAYGELTDPAEQKRRFSKTISTRSACNKSELEMPGRFLSALEQGIPPCSGIALGVERLLMLILGESSINDIHLFDFSNLL